MKTIFGAVNNTLIAFTEQLVRFASTAGVTDLVNTASIAGRGVPKRLAATPGHRRVAHPEDVADVVEDAVSLPARVNPARDSGPSYPTDSLT